MNSNFMLDLSLILAESLTYPLIPVPLAMTAQEFH